MRLRRGDNAQRAAAAIAVAIVLLAGVPSQQCLAQPPAAETHAPTTSPPAAPSPSTTRDARRAASQPPGAADAPGGATQPAEANTTAAAPQTPPAPNAPPSGDASPDAAPAAIVEQPRPFGYVLGDTMTQRALLPRDFEPESVPPLERTGLWFARRASKIQRMGDGHRWLVMEYQLVNAPQTLLTVNLPTVTLKSKAGGALAVQPWPISVAPLTPHAVFAKGGLQELRPDHPAPMLPTSTLQRQLKVWLTAFAITVAAWLVWWLVRSIRAAANQPFARALREVRQAGEDNGEAWLALHRAFDRTAGRALQTSTLPGLFKQAPHFESERAAIEQFYNQSNLRFFGGVPTRAQSDDEHRSSPAASATTTATQPVALRALATTLRRIEKQHER